MDQISRTTPRSLEDLTPLQHRLGELLRAMDVLATQAQKECAPILKKAEAKTRPLRREALQIGRTIDAFARMHKAELTNNGKKKTVKIPGGGELKWRMSKPAVQLADEDAVLQHLVSKGIEVFIRRTPSVNKTAMAEHPIKASRIPGVTIRPNRKFIIVPSGAPERLERAMGSKRLEIVRPKSRE